MPLVSQTFDQLLDFTRTTSGTFVGSNDPEHASQRELAVADAAV